jgi:hypothetical protein
LEADHKVIDIAHQAGFASQSALHNALEPEVEHMMEVKIAQKYADRSTLRRAFLIRSDFPVFEDTRFQPAPDQTDQARITDSMLNKAESPVVTETPEEVLQIRLQHPADLAASNGLVEGCQGMMRAKPGPAAKRTGQKVLLVDRGQHLGRTALERSVRDGRDAQRAPFRLAGLGDIDSPDIRRSIPVAVDGSEHGLDPFVEVFLRRLHRLSIHPGGRAFRNLCEILPYPIARDVMGERCEAEFWFASSLCYYLFKFRCHGQLISSLDRRPYLPLNGAHVAQEQFIFR